jgi:hypothetical protein
MKKNLIRTPGLILLAIIMIVSILSPIATYAYRGPWAYFSGMVTMSGKNVPTGSIVRATIKESNGSTWTTNVYLRLGHSKYELYIPMYTGDNSGGVNGNVVYFEVDVNGVRYSDESNVICTWQSGVDQDHNIILSANPVNQVTIVTSSLPTGTVGLDYPETTLQATGGDGNYTWTVSGLPLGLTLSPDGKITGKPNFSDARLTALSNVVYPEFKVNGQGAKTIPLTILWKNADANGDGLIDMSDADYVISIFAGVSPENPAADANGDGKIDMGDYLKIQRIVLKIDPE